MATLSERLTKRFRGVPGVTATDITDWIAEAVAESGFAADSPTDDRNNALLYLALSIGFSVIATDAARYFRYTDAEETVDKTMVAAQYVKLSAQARRDYAKALRGGYGASASYSGRGDGR
ncbi:hypothetical protein [Paenibacillus abyssi]|uniref:Uncharacterized protein n=1 Tax=Paenibacillus abyssi TaxID=1340531 RepID=A0A917CJ92_9BACL|nr:hypothetical protein [Paenibacillus abyssi]GGF88448.1 hypothetical protein GCM10010916_02240 [Paenibacillus abyssi]